MRRHFSPHNIAPRDPFLRHPDPYHKPNLHPNPNPKPSTNTLTLTRVRISENLNPQRLHAHSVPGGEGFRVAGEVATRQLVPFGRQPHPVPGSWTCLRAAR